MEINIEIKSIIGEVIFEFKKENNTIKDTVFQANLINANLRGADLRGANLSEANLINADLRGANLSEANLINADLRGANLINANLRGANLINANLINADLRGADLRGADLSEANLINADLSNAKNMFDSIKYLEENFKWTKEGLIVYKTFGEQYKINNEWCIEPGSIISENVNSNITQDCGCGINVANIEWVKQNYKGEVWKLLIKNAWLPSVVVPLNTTGKIRCGKAQLIKIVK